MMHPSSPPALGAGALHVVGAAIVGEVEAGDVSPKRRCLAAQRSATMSNALLWEFPGGKVEADELPQAALRREILEELGIDVAVDGWLGRSTLEIHPAVDVDKASRVITREVLYLDVYMCRWLGGEIQLAEHRDWRWVTADEVPELDWSPADRPLLGNLCAVLQS